MVSYSSPDILCFFRKRESKQAPQVQVRDEDDSENTVILFPGQGAQFVGMGKKAVDIAPKAKQLFDRASNILKFDLYQVRSEYGLFPFSTSMSVSILQLCTQGPKQRLDETLYCQPATVVTSLACVEALWTQDEDAVKNCIATAGFSVGEITALIFSGALSFEDGVRLVAARGEAMQYASEMEDTGLFTYRSNFTTFFNIYLFSGMMTVFYFKDANVGLACESARKWAKSQFGVRQPVCQIATYLYAGAKVIAGHKEALDFIDANKKDFGIRRVKRLPVSGIFISRAPLVGNVIVIDLGAFHTPAMDYALDAFELALGSCEFSRPRIPVFSNFENLIYRDASLIKKTLPKQMTKCIKWEQSLNSMLKYKNSEHLPNIIECGPGSGLTSMLKNLNGNWANRSTFVEA